MKKVLYNGSKAVKITSDMRNGLNAFNNDYNIFTKSGNEIDRKQVKLNEMRKQLDNLIIKSTSNDRKTAKEASKQIKIIEKDIQNLEKQLQEEKGNRKEQQKCINSMDLEGAEIIEFPFDKPEEKEITQEPTIRKKPIINFFRIIDSEEKHDNVKSKIENSKSEENENPFNIPVISNKDDKHKKIGESEEIKPVNIDSLPEISEEKSIVDGDFKTLVKKPEIKPIIDKKLPKKEIKEEKITSIPEIVPNYNEEKMEPIEAKPVDIKKFVNEEIYKDIPKVDTIESVDSNNLVDSIYNEVDLEKEELDISKDRDIKNLTLFRDYLDYTFTFGQQRFHKEDLTHEEFESLSDLKSFLDEKTFETKRINQFKKIINADKRLKRQITKLTKEFQKNIDAISNDYNKNVEKLNKALESARKQAETDRVAKIQTQKLNDSLTMTISEQKEKINELTTKNNDLEETVSKQEKQIEKLEATNNRQAGKIKDFENKLNTVLGIVKGVNK